MLCWYTSLPSSLLPLNKVSFLPRHPVCLVMGHDVEVAQAATQKHAKAPGGG